MYLSLLRLASQNTDATTDQIITIHTFVVALWKVGIRARRFAFGIVALASLFVALWVGIANGVHKNFETPTHILTATISRHIVHS